MEEEEEKWIELSRQNFDVESFSKQGPPSPAISKGPSIQSKQGIEINEPSPEHPDVEIPLIPE